MIALYGHPCSQGKYTIIHRFLYHTSILWWHSWYHDHLPWSKPTLYAVWLIVGHNIWIVLNLRTLHGNFHPSLLLVPPHYPCFRWSVIITRDSEVIMFSPCVFVCLFVCVVVYVCHDVCPDDLTMKDWCHTNNILQAHCWGCLVVQVMFRPLMTQTDSDKVYSTKIYTSTISGLHEFLRNTNNTIVLIYK